MTNVPYKNAPKFLFKYHMHIQYNTNEIKKNIPKFAT